MVTINMFKNYLSEEFSPPKMRSTYIVSINSNSSKNQYDNAYLYQPSPSLSTTQLLKEKNSAVNNANNLHSSYRQKYLSTTYINLPLLKPYEVKLKEAVAVASSDDSKKVNLFVTHVASSNVNKNNTSRCNNNNSNRNRATSFIYIDDDRSSLDLYSEDEYDLSESISRQSSFSHNKLKTENFQQGISPSLMTLGRNENLFSKWK